MGNDMGSGLPPWNPEPKSKSNRDDQAQSEETNGQVGENEMITEVSEEILEQLNQANQQEQKIPDKNIGQHPEAQEIVVSEEPIQQDEQIIQEVKEQQPVAEESPEPETKTKRSYHYQRYTTRHKCQALQLLDKGYSYRKTAKLTGPYCSSATPFRWKKAEREIRRRDLEVRRQARREAEQDRRRSGAGKDD